jgi:hypothetical protein
MAKLNRVGEKYTTNEGYIIEITEYNSSNDVEISFQNGYKVKCQFISVLKGNIKNPYHKSVCGVGFLGDGVYKTNTNKKETKTYKHWRSMLQRCYNEKAIERRKNYKGCTVVEEWHNFQNFAKWFEDNYMEGWQLDKDILVKGNKVYSPQTCCFLPPEINIQFTSKTNKKLSGIVKRKNSFLCQVGINGKRVYIGSYKTEEEAAYNYRITREDYIKVLANKYKQELSDQVFNTLINFKIE